MQSTEELRRALVVAEGRELRQALIDANGSAQKAAELLSITRQTVWRRMRRHGIEIQRVVKPAA